MKINSLNKFLGKKVDVEYWCREGCLTDCVRGIAEEIGQGFITIENKTSLRKISIEDIMHIKIQK